MPEADGYGRDKPFVTDDDFGAIMKARHGARRPVDQCCSACEFWRTLWGMAWVTGMQKLVLLSLRWDDLDLTAGIALSRYRDNKGKMDPRHKIGPVVGLLRGLRGVRRPGEPRLFPWSYALRTLDRELARIQEAAGIHLPSREDRGHTPACHLYEFRSFSYAHATYNFRRVSDRDPQEQMGHTTFCTTQRYIKSLSGKFSRCFRGFHAATR
jgi:integrase